MSDFILKTGTLLWLIYFKFRCFYGTNLNMISWPQVLEIKYNNGVGLISAKGRRVCPRGPQLFLSTVFQWGPEPEALQHLQVLRDVYAVTGFIKVSTWLLSNFFYMPFP